VCQHFNKNMIYSAKEKL